MGKLKTCKTCFTIYDVRQCPLCKTSKAVKDIIDHCELFNIKIVAYGLAPNPFGFTYEIHNQGNWQEHQVSCETKLCAMLGDLTASQERELKERAL